MTNPIIKERLNLLDPNYRKFVLSSVPTTISEVFSETYKLDEIKSIVLENGIVLFLLFFFDRPDLKNYIITDCGLTESEATLLTEGIILALPENIRLSHEKTRQLIFNNIKNNGDTEIIKNITEAEAVLDTINPIRTMEKDNRTSDNLPQENVHTSTQSTILNDNKTPSNWVTGK